jgi:predicted DCC family thiol-disulfide oxidoreductase YuxK
MQPEAVLFFDGECGLCNGWVDFLMARDLRGRIKYSPLQSQYAASQLEPAQVRDLLTLVVAYQGNVYKKSRAVLLLGRLIGGFWGLLATLLGLCPSAIADVTYDFIAQNRYRWFGKRQACRMPTAEERARFVL